MSTYLDILKQARRLLADSADVSYDEQELLAFANEGVARFAVLTQACVDYKTVSATTRLINRSVILKSGQDDLITVWRVLAIQGSTRYLLPQGALSDSKLSQSTPTRWIMTQSGLLLDSATIPSGLQLEIIYSFLPANAELPSSTLAIPAQWMTAIVCYTAACAALQARDVSLANGLMAEFNDYVNAARIKTTSEIIGQDKAV